MKNLLWTFFIMPVFSFAQNWNIDNALKKIPHSKQKSIEILCAYIAENSASDLEKVRGVYFWIAHNIKYDARRFFKDKESFSEAEEVFKKRKAVCEGYANLFAEMCANLNLECEKINGYDKGYGYKSGQPLYESTHAWNAVKIGNEWHLFDVTWASGDIHKRLFRKFTFAFHDEYFDMKPKEMIIAHLPETPMWQLLEYPVPPKIFNNDEKKLYAFLKNPASEKYNFNDTISKWISDTLNWHINYALMAMRYNADNTTPLAYAKIELADNILEEYKYYHPDFRTKKDKRKYLPFYYYKYFSMNKIDSIITTYSEAKTLLKNSKHSSKSKKEIADGNIIYCADEISDMYVSKAQKQFNFIYGIRTKNIDSITVHQKKCFESLEKSLNEIFEDGSRHQFKLFTKEFCSAYFFAHAIYYSHLMRETDAEKKNNWAKEFEAFKEKAKKVVPKDCKCYKKIQNW